MKEEYIIVEEEERSRRVEEVEEVEEEEEESEEGAAPGQVSCQPNPKCPYIPNRASQPVNCDCPASTLVRSLI